MTEFNSSSRWACRPQGVWKRGGRFTWDGGEEAHAQLMCEFVHFARAPLHSAVVFRKSPSAHARRARFRSARLNLNGSIWALLQPAVLFPVDAAAAPVSRRAPSATSLIWVSGTPGSWPVSRRNSVHFCRLVKTNCKKPEANALEPEPARVEWSGAKPSREEALALQRKIKD